MSKVYLSGPITGLTYGEARYTWREEFAKKAPGIRVLSPMRHEGHLAEMRNNPIYPNTVPEGLFSHPKMIVTKDFLDIDACTIMIVNFLGAKAVSQGTLVEMGYAKAKGKTIITIQDDFDTIHTSPFIEVLSDIVVPSIDDAIAVTSSLLSEGV